MFRAYRFGQTKPVYIYRLVAHGTMEEKVYNRQITKQDLATRVIDKDKEEQIGRHFTDEELRRLYDFDSEGKTAEDFAAVTPPDAEDSATSAAPAPVPSGAQPGAPAKKTFSYLGLPTKEDGVLTGILRKFRPQWIVGYHPTDSLIDENDARLTEEEERAAWAEYERSEAEEVAARQRAREAERMQRAMSAQAGRMPVPVPVPVPVRGGGVVLSEQEQRALAQAWHQQINQQYMQMATSDPSSGFRGMRLTPEQQLAMRQLQAQQMASPGAGSPWGVRLGSEEAARIQQQIYQREQLRIQQELMQQHHLHSTLQRANGSGGGGPAATAVAAASSGSGRWTAEQLSAMPTAMARPASIHQPGSLGYPPAASRPPVARAAARPPA